jgi:hypothetical protein
MCVCEIDGENTFQMTRILVPVFLLVFLFPSLALGEEVTGNFKCKIKDITILTMEEGLPKTYKPFEEGSTIGEKCILNMCTDPQDIIS